MPFLYQLSLLTSMNGNRALNIFNYFVTGADATAENVGDCFTANVLLGLVSSVSAQVVFEGYQVVQLTSPNDSHRQDYTAVSGGRSSACLPPFTAYGIQLNTPSTSFRAGGKRFMGVAESDQDDGIIDFTHKAVLDTLADTLAKMISIAGLDIQCTPCLVRETSPSTWIAGFVTGASYKRITSQNSRKIGRGDATLPSGATVSPPQDIAQINTLAGTGVAVKAFSYITDEGLSPEGVQLSKNPLTIQIL